VLKNSVNAVDSVKKSAVHDTRSNLNRPTR